MIPQGFSLSRFNEKIQYLYGSYVSFDSISSEYNGMCIRRGPNEQVTPAKASILLSSYTKAPAKTDKKLEYSNSSFALDIQSLARVFNGRDPR